MVGGVLGVLLLVLCSCSWSAEVVPAQDSQQHGAEQGGAVPSTTDVYEVVSVEDYAVMFNQYRQSRGCSALVFTEDLTRVAELRLREIQVSFNHFSVGGFNRHLAENITMISFGGLSDREAFDSWMSSPGHNANMLNPEYVCTGYANGGGYAVQVFSSYPTVNGEPQLPPGWYWDD